MFVRISCIFAFSCALSAANYTTYPGDVGTTYNVAAIAADSSGNTYVTGTRNSYLGTDIFFPQTRLLTRKSLEQSRPRKPAAFSPFVKN